MLKIKEHVASENAITGKDLLKAMQNQSTPLLDLFVRESLQNSLDAQDLESDSTKVEVDYITGDFESDKLCGQLERLESISKNRLEDGKHRFLAIRDAHTNGLTGPLSADEVRDGRYGNLQKLVYQIFKNQETAGAGGSHGIGKTTYYRIGVGMVIYYSRISLGYYRYENRLSIALVEDPQSRDKILKSDSTNPTGIAWWGDVSPTGCAMPITDKDTIKEIVEDIFGIPLYEGSQTGTTIIIPCVDEKDLLSHNKTKYPLNYKSECDDEVDNTPDQYIEKPWENTIEEYLKIAVQRWYAPRLNNLSYFSKWKSKYLEVRVNSTEISDSNMLPLFKIVKAMYNAALGFSKDETDIEINVENIIIRKQLIDTTVGKLAYTCVSREILGLKPWHKLTPATYFNCSVGVWGANTPILGYMRKPGMLVTYTDQAWVKNTNAIDENHFLIGIFVLNGENELKKTTACPDNDDYTLEAYVRECEKSDHMRWEDIKFKALTDKPTIIEKASNSVSKKLEAYINSLNEDAKEPERPDYNPASTLLGDLLLPPEGSGTGPSDTSTPSGGSGNLPITKTKTFKYTSNVTFVGNDMFLRISLSTLKGKVATTFVCELQTESSGSPIAAQTWEDETGLDIPVTIDDCSVEDFNGGNVSLLDCKGIKTQNGNCYGFKFSFPESSVDMKFTYKLKLNRKDVKPNIRIM